MIRLFVFILTTVSLMASSSLAYATQAIQNVTLNQVSSELFEGPAHHGLGLEINPIQDPNLTAFEIQVKEDTPGPAPWNVYAINIYPVDSSEINLPYRNGIYSLVAGKTYCLRLRGIFGDKLSAWSSKCGVSIPIISNDQKDSDGDGVADATEYNLGADPNNKDSDQDGYVDGQEVDNNFDINEVKFPNLELLTSVIDFGIGDPSGTHKNQHAFVELQNKGLEPVTLSNIEITNASPNNTENYFEVGSYPNVLSYIPPHNKLRIPVSFLPKGRGEVSALLTVNVPINGVALKPVILKGVGVGIPDCQVSPQTLDFGTTSVGAQEALVKYITVANKPPANSTAPKNMDADFGFTLSTTSLAMAPGLRGYVLAPGEEIKIPVLFQHPLPGVFDSELIINSFDCVTQKIILKGVAQ